MLGFVVMVWRENQMASKLHFIVQTDLNKIHDNTKLGSGIARKIRFANMERSVITEGYQKSLVFRRLLEVKIKHSESESLVSTSLNLPC